MGQWKKLSELMAQYSESLLKSPRSCGLNYPMINSTYAVSLIVNEWIEEGEAWDMNGGKRPEWPLTYRGPQG